MSLQDLDSLRPFVYRLKRSIRWWWMTTFYMWVGFIALCMCAASGKLSENVAAGLFIGHVLITLILYFKNNNRNILLREVFKEFKDIEKVSLLAPAFKNISSLAKTIFFLDLFLFPFTFVFKFVFWILYRIFKLRIRKLRKLMSKGAEIAGTESIESDPFYGFLLQEGLYEKPKKGLFDSEEELEEDEEKDSEEQEDEK